MKAGGKVQLPTVFRTVKGADLLGIKVWFTPANMEPLIVQVLEYIYTYTHTYTHTV